MHATSDRFDRQCGLCAQARRNGKFGGIALTPRDQVGFLPAEAVQFFTDEPFSFGVGSFAAQLPRMVLTEAKGSTHSMVRFFSYSEGVLLWHRRRG